MSSGGSERERNAVRADERRSARSKVFVAATIECGNARFPVRVINLSIHGVLVAGEATSPDEEAVTLRCGGLKAAGWIARVRPQHIAINFEAPIKPRTVARKMDGGSDLITRDTRKLDFRRPGFRGNQMTAEERQIVEAWQREQEDLGSEGSPSRDRPDKSGGN